MKTAEDRGWGPGWPQCDVARKATTRIELLGITWRFRTETVWLWQDLIPRWDATVERLTAEKGCWSYDCRPIRDTTDKPSNHSWGLAADLNAAPHPRGKRGTFEPAQVTAIRAVLARYEGLVIWGGDYTGTPDEHHVEIIGTPQQVAALEAKLSGAELGGDVNHLRFVQYNGCDALYVTDGMRRRWVRSRALRTEYEKLGVNPDVVVVAKDLVVNDLELVGPEHDHATCK